MLNNRFSVQPPPHVGLSDKLWHLYVLYKLGVALSYQYVHMPFSCPRSCRTAFIHRLLGNLIDLIYAIFGWLFNRAPYRTDKLTHFLGLDLSHLELNQQPHGNKPSLIRIDLDIFFSHHASLSLALMVR